MNRMIKYDIQETLHFQKRGKMWPYLVIVTIFWGDCLWENDDELYRFYGILM